VALAVYFLILTAVLPGLHTCRPHGVPHCGHRDVTWGLDAADRSETSRDHSDEICPACAVLRTPGAVADDHFSGVPATLHPVRVPGGRCVLPPRDDTLLCLLPRAPPSAV